MQQAILITAYKNNNHLNDIVDFFHQENYLHFIHIDKKSKFDEKDIEKIKSKHNVKLVSKEYTINWGGINHLKSILLLLEEAFKSSDAEYFHLITGHDYPIKSAACIDSFLEKNRNKEYLEYNKLPYASWENGGMDRYTLYNLYDWVDARSGWGERFVKNTLKLQRKLRIKRKFPDNFPPLYGGSTYWSISRKFVEYIFQYIKEHPQYLKRFKHTFCSEEVFFQTIIMNSPFKQNVVNDSLRFIVWEKRNGNFPANLDETDYDNILGSKALFARKFEFPVSEKLVEKIKADHKMA